MFCAELGSCPWGQTPVDHLLGQVFTSPTAPQARQTHVFVEHRLCLLCLELFEAKLIWSKQILADLRGAANAFRSSCQTKCWACPTSCLAVTCHIGWWTFTDRMGKHGLFGSIETQQVCFSSFTGMQRSASKHLDQWPWSAWRDEVVRRCSEMARAERPGPPVRAKSGPTVHVGDTKQFPPKLMLQITSNNNWLLQDWTGTHTFCLHAGICSGLFRYLIWSCLAWGA